MMGLNVGAQVDALKRHYENVYDCLDIGRVAGWQEHVKREYEGPSDFGLRGRGQSYVSAQRSIQVRANGIMQLIDIALSGNSAESDVFLDLLGGDGLVSRVLSLRGYNRHVVVTCDASPFMVEEAWAQGFPALLQRAEQSLFRDGSVGGVLLAYGSHHIPSDGRGAVAAEAFRVLQRGGAFVLHDFLVGSPAERWFAEAVDAYSSTGHNYPHFERAEILSHLTDAGFSDIRLVDIDDGYVTWGATEGEAELAMGKYLLEMYGLVRLLEGSDEEGAYRQAFSLGRKIFRYDDGNGKTIEAGLRHNEGVGMWAAEMPRRAIVGFGRKA